MKPLRHLCVDTVLYGLIAALAISSLAQWHYLAELTTHFMLQYILLATMLLFMLYAGGAKRWKKITAILLIAAFGLQIGVAILPRPVTTSDVYEDLTVLQFNIHRHRTAGIGEVLTWLGNTAHSSNNPDGVDIVLLQEITPEIAGELAQLRPRYPYQLLKPKQGGFGMAILSRLPIESSARYALSEVDIHATRVNFTTPKKHIPLSLTELHVMPPLGARRADLRNKHLHETGRLIAKQKASSKILIGDMNVTPYSPYFKALEKQTSLISATRGQKILGTWPTFLPIIFRLPIDHMLVSDNIKILTRTTKHGLGSDHLPVITRFRIYKPQ